MFQMLISYVSRFEAHSVSKLRWCRARRGVSRDWSTAGKLLSIQCIEAEVGDRLRLPEYRQLFGSDTAQSLVETLAEGQPPV